MGQKINSLRSNNAYIISKEFSKNEDECSELTDKNSFLYINVIGRGGFGKVWKVLHKKTRIIYAMKEMSKTKIIDRNSQISIKNERFLLSKMFHPFIVNMHFSFQDKDNLYLVLDYLSGGDLRYHLCMSRNFTENQTKFFLCCLILAIEYVHSNNIIHRDLKPENLVMDSDGYLKLTDFGIAKIYNKNIDNYRENSGTIGYMAPEVLFNMNHDYRCDYYALGIIGYELMCLCRPFSFKSRKEAKEIIAIKQPKITKKNLKEGWSLNFADLINKLILRKPEQRLGKGGIEEIKQHPWLKFFNWKDLYLHKYISPFIPMQGENYDKKFCNYDENITEHTKIRYKNIVQSMQYKFIFDDYKYYDRSQDHIMKKEINKEMNFSFEKNYNINFSNNKNINDIIKKSQNIANEKTRNKKSGIGKYTLENLNNMISQYKSCDGNDENKNNNVLDPINELDIKICTNPHLIYKALEQKEIECFSNDEEKEQKAMKRKQKKHKVQYRSKEKIINGEKNKVIKSLVEGKELVNEKNKFHKKVLSDDFENKKISNNINNYNNNININVNVNINNKKDKNKDKGKNIKNDKSDDSSSINNNIKVKIIFDKKYKNDIDVHDENSSGYQQDEEGDFRRKFIKVAKLKKFKHQNRNNDI